MMPQQGAPWEQGGTGTLAMPAPAEHGAVALKSSFAQGSFL